MKLTPTHIQSARRHLRAADPVMRSIIDAVGRYTLRFERDRFGLLVRSIVSQIYHRGPSDPQAVAGTCWSRWAEQATWPGSQSSNCGRSDCHDRRRPMWLIFRAR